MSATNQRGKNVVNASSGNTTRSQRRSAASVSSASSRSTTSLRVSARSIGPSWAAPTVSRRVTPIILTRARGTRGLWFEGPWVPWTRVLEVDGLVRHYGPVTALDGMTFAVEPGSVTGFLGPNGAGKTTTMRAVFGLTALDAGSVRFDGQPIDLEVRRRFGYLPEERGLYPTMRIAEQLSFLGALRGMDRKAADREARRWLGELGLADRVDDQLEDLSLGNQQRVQLISALLHEPDVLILDEPFSGLDPVAVEALSKVLVGEARRGATVLFSSHQLDLVEDLCERAVVVDRGRVVTAGTIDDLTAGGDPVLEIDVPSDP